MSYVWDPNLSTLSRELQRLSVDIAVTDPDFAYYLQELEREARRLEDHDGTGNVLEELAEAASDVVGRPKGQKARDTIEAAIARAGDAVSEEQVRDTLPAAVIEQAEGRYGGKDALELIQDAGAWAAEYLDLRDKLTAAFTEALGESVAGANGDDFVVYVERLASRVPEDGEELAKLRRFVLDADSLAPDVEKLRQLAGALDSALELLDGLGKDARKLAGGRP